MIAQAQPEKRGNVWIFGDSVGLDFNSGSPVVIPSNCLVAIHSPTCIADSNGNLVAYISKKYQVTGPIVDSSMNYYQHNFFVLDGNHQVIDTSFRGKYNPHLIHFDDQKLHIVSFDEMIIYGATRIVRMLVFYHRINLQTRTVEVKNRILYQTPDSIPSNIIPGNIFYQEQFKYPLLFVQHANGRDWWFYTFYYEYIGRPGVHRYYQFLMTPDTCYYVDTFPLSPTVHGLHSTFQGLVTYGCDNDYVYLCGASGYDYLNFYKAVLRFKVNRFTGRIDSLYETIQPPALTGVENYATTSMAVSPNQRYLYFINSVPPSTHVPASTQRIYQCDLQAGTPTQISNSCTPIWDSNLSNTNLSLWTLKLGPDGKIYCTGNCPSISYYSPHLPQNIGWDSICMNLSVIHYPDSGGNACQFEKYALPLNGRRSFGIFPNIPSYASPCTPQVAECGLPADTIGVGLTHQLGIAPYAGLQYSWSPTDYLSDPTISNPTITAPSLDTTITYVLTVTDPSKTGCCNQTQDSIKITFSRSVSREHLTYQTLEIYPNPAESIVSVVIPETGKLRILNVLGEVVWERNCSSGEQEISVADLPAGMYLVEFQNRSGRKVAGGKLFLQR
ncbi:MAG: T9SS type A sorting domain-containing protein [Bacteroidia bacterium]|nr:T9SS type A sorting domain-containing protein [Bacteroidia bacterium]